MLTSKKNLFLNHLKPLVKAALPSRIRLSIQKRIAHDNRIRIYFNNSLTVINKDGSVEGVLPMFYWDSEPNFGDVIGPYLVSNIANMPIMNTLNTDTPCLMAVGSILNMIDRNGVVVWGSGLIDEPSSKELYKIRNYKPQVLSVRGKKTSDLLEKSGISVVNKDAYGDPALLMPMFYKPKAMDSNKISVCPHFLHKPEFKKAIQVNDNISIIDVQKNMESVVDEIASSSVCISTSLHGLIISQAYGIPWVWLEVIDNNLKGNDFKFLDFFSTIEQKMVSHVQVKRSDIKDLNFEELAKQASLPKKLYNEKLILDALEQHLTSITTNKLSYLPERNYQLK